MKKLITLSILAFALFACNRIKEETKSAINKGGETAGKTATEFMEGVTEGVDKTLQCEIVLSQELKDKGLRTGKFSVSDDTAGGENNMLTLYLIFDKDFKDHLSVTAFDKNGLEIGRTGLDVEAKKNYATYFDLRFDKRTYIEVKSKIMID